jgi:hypothetical protein
MGGRLLWLLHITLSFFVPCGSYNGAIFGYFNVLDTHRIEDPARLPPFCRSKAASSMKLPESGFVVEVMLMHFLLFSI